MTATDTFNGVPVDADTENDRGPVTARGRWPVSDNDNFPGDVIRWPPVLSKDPRFLEHLTREVTDKQWEARPPLLIREIDVSEPVMPCTFCSHEGGVCERGVIDADYRLVTSHGNVVAHTCHACIMGAPDGNVDQFLGWAEVHAPELVPEVVTD